METAAKVAAVAVAEPQMAPNTVHPATVAIARPPAICPTNLLAVSYSLFAIPAWKASWPIKMKRGTTVRLYDSKQSKISLATRFNAACGETI